MPIENYSNYLLLQLVHHNSIWLLYNFPSLHCYPWAIYNYILVEKVSLGCFSIKAFRSHGLLNVRPILCIYSNTFISKQIIRTLPSYSANQKYPFLLNNSFFQRIVYSIQRIPDNLLNQCKLTCSIHNSFEVFFFQKFINCSTPFQVFMTDFTQFEFYT